MTDRDRFFNAVKKHVDQLDCCELLSGGAPKDEYDLESREISVRISPEQSAEAIADIIASVFNSSFDMRKPSSDFLVISECIKKDIL